MAAKKSVSNSRIHVVVGSDEGVVREQSLKLWRELTQGVDDGFTHETIEGNADKVDQVTAIISRTLQALLTYSMFGGDKVVWLRNATFFGNDRTSESETTLQAVEDLLKQLSAGLPEGVSMILSAPKIDKRRAFWKFLEKHADVQTHDMIDISKDNWEAEVAALVVDKAGALDLTFAEDALELFVMQAGEATNQIVNELEKLSLYLGERRNVEIEDVRVMVPLSRIGVIFETGKALQSGDAARAIALIDEQLEFGESAVAIMRASIIPTVRSLFMSRILIERAKASPYSYRDFEAAVNRLPPEEKAWLPQKKSGDGVNIYPLFMAAKGAQAFTLKSLANIFHATARADKMLVTTGLDERLLLHRLVTEIASAAAVPKNKQSASKA